MPRKPRTALKSLRKIMDQSSVKRAPLVQAIEPEVRTDMNLPVTPGINVPDRGKRLKNGELLGVYIVEWGYDVPEDQWIAFHDWLSKNERQLAETCPGGIEYRGTYLAVFGPTHRADGRYSTFWGLTSLADIEDFGTKGKKEFQKLMREFHSFRDTQSGTGFSQLYQIAAGTPGY